MKKFILILYVFATIIGCKKEDSTPIVSPVSAFTFSKVPGAFKNVQFQNASHFITTSSKYLWTFGDGNTSTDENPLFEFQSEGNYKVVLKVTNGSYSDCSMQQVTISSTIADTVVEIPQVMFTFSQSGKAVQFQNASSNTKKTATYSWNFGDGDTSKFENISHIYKNDGIYSVVLKVSQNNKSYSYSKSILVTNSLYASYDTIRPVPSFVVNYKGNTVYFTNTSSFASGNTKFTWNFGDGAVSNSESIDHTYANGTYNVSLRLDNSKYSVSYSATIVVPFKETETVDPTIKPVASFVFSQKQSAIYFQNSSSNVTPTSTYFWTFGDGNTSTAENPYYLYPKSGNFKVVLKVTTNNVSDSYSATVNIP